MKENMIVIRDPRTFYFNFHWPKDVDENLKHEIGFIRKSNKSLPENKIKNKVEQLLLKDKTWKTAKRMNHINLSQISCQKD